MRQALKDSSLTLVMLGLFAIFGLGQSLSGWRHHDQEARLHGRSPSSYLQYLRSGEFIEATFENWESEFLQMGAFVLFTAFLKQKGSPESKPPEGDPEHDADPGKEKTADSPGPVHRGGLALKLYSHSLSVALFALFLLSFGLHAVGGTMQFNDEARAHGQPAVSFLSFVASSTFWFESFQNWQSEFLSVGVLLILSIFLRQKGSPESKPVHAPHRENE
jgi:hypothetical protein